MLSDMVCRGPFHVLLVSPSLFLTRTSGLMVRHAVGAEPTVSGLRCGIVVTGDART